MVSCLSCHLWACGGKTAHTVPLRLIHMLRLLRHLSKNRTGTSFVFLHGFVSFLLLSSSDISHCVAIRSLSVFQSFLVEKTEWLIKKTLSIYFGGWMHRSALMSDLRNPSFIKKELAHRWLRTKCNSCICITKTRLIDLIWDSSWVCCLFALNCSCLVATAMPSSFPIDITWRQRSSPRITGKASRGNSSLM